MRIAYADPPYPGDAWMYGRREVDHVRLVAALRRFDGWALSTSSHALHLVAPICGPDVRCGSWVKTNGVLGDGTKPVSAWEPVFYVPARPRRRAKGKVIHGTREGDPICLDWVRSPRFVGGIGNGFRGAKPPEFCGWLFDLLGATPDDEFHDLFHGSGAVKRAWAQWCATAKAGGPLFVKEGA
jgi:hypothetical protein